jgi:hypothetical protein
MVSDQSSFGILSILPVLFYYIAKRKDHGFLKHGDRWSGFKTPFYIPLSHSQPVQYGMDLDSQI